ncbi:ThuA domain-containing protein [Aurantiacibacter odishensis]|uniref:ThuA domain-containing protein n=1 Tax=Aurantiacibacter odishensis TaxID=1155476 RepID=UPI0030B83054
MHLVAAGKYHDIDFARLELLKLLAEVPEIRTSVATNYSDKEAIENCDLLITYTCDLVPSDDEVETLSNWLRGGGRWLALHGTNSILRFSEQGTVETPDEASEFMRLLGTQFAGHPPIAAFRVTITERDHPLTKGLRDFSVVDELYLTRTLGDFTTLMHTTFKGKCEEFGDAEWDESEVPVLYERTFGAGTILYLTLGHCRGHYDLQPLAGYYPHPERCAWNYPVFYELLRRAIRWGAGNA